MGNVPSAEPLLPISIHNLPIPKDRDFRHKLEREGVTFQFTSGLTVPTECPAGWFLYKRSGTGDCVDYELYRGDGTGVARAGVDLTTHAASCYMVPLNGSVDMDDGVVEDGWYQSKTDRNSRFPEMAKNYEVMCDVAKTRGTHSQMECDEFYVKLEAQARAIGVSIQRISIGE
jgi:hypothetical protein